MLLWPRAVYTYRVIYALMGPSTNDAIWTHDAMASSTDEPMVVHARCHEPSPWETIPPWGAPWHSPWAHCMCHGACHGIGLNHGAVRRPWRRPWCTMDDSTVQPLLPWCTSMEYAMGTHGTCHGMAAMCRWCMASSMDGTMDTRHGRGHGIVHGRTHGVLHRRCHDVVHGGCP